MRTPLLFAITAIALGGVAPVQAQLQFDSGTANAPIQLIVNTDQIFDTSASLFSAPLLNQGWWNGDGFHSQGSFRAFSLYLCENCSSQGGHGFATFDLSALELPATSAILRLPFFTWFGMSPFDVRFFDVTTGANLLNQLEGNYTALAGIYDDLGSGNLYAQLHLQDTTPDSGFGGSVLYFDVPLSAQAIQDINASQRGFFSIGAANIGSDVPEPTSFTLILSGVALYLGIRLRRALPAILLCCAAAPGLLWSQPASATPGGVVTIAGSGTRGFSGDGGPAVRANLASPGGLAIDAAGRILFADGGNGRIRRINADGTISTIAGNGSDTDSGDGGPATVAGIRPSGLAVDTAGNIYVSEEHGYVVRKINTAGVITTIAGTGAFGFSGDGGPATKAALNAPKSVAVDSSGNVYIADAANSRIRKINSQGVITTFAGGGNRDSCADNGPATQACLCGPDAVAIGPDDSVYIADSCGSSIRKVTSAGIISTLAKGSLADAAVESTLSHELYSISVDRSGTVFVADHGARRIRRVSIDGYIETVAGNGAYGYSGDGGPATSASFFSPDRIAVDADGNLLISDYGSNRVRRVNQPVFCRSFPVDLIPFVSVTYVTEPNSVGDRLVVGDIGSNYDAISRLPVPTGKNQAFCGSAPLARERLDTAYLPDPAERMGRYAGFAGLLLDPLTNQPFPAQGDAALIPASRIGKIFAWRIAPWGGSPAFRPAGVVNAASYQTGLVPGSLAVLYGRSLSVGVNGVVPATASPWPEELAGVKVMTKWWNAPVYVVANVNGQEQINFQVPWELKGESSASVSVINAIAMSESVSIPVSAVQPAPFLLSATQIAAVHADGSTISTSNPARAGEVIIIYATGLGAVSNQPRTGAAAASSPLSNVLGTTLVTIDGTPARVLFSGLAPGFVGVYQLNVETPKAYAGDPKGFSIAVTP